MEISSDVKRVINDLKAGRKMIAMVAPSFVIDFKYPDLIAKLKKLGFDKVSELTFGARIINRYYHELIKKHPDKMFISTACPVVTMMIKKQYSKYIDNLAPIVSPLGATARIMRKNCPECDLVFIAPCPAKKEEAKVYGDLIRSTVTFQELKQLLDYAEENKLFTHPEPEDHLFDKFYEDYTKIYPLSGGLSKTLHKKDILKPEQVLVLEGPKEMQELLSKDIPKNIKFLDILFCKGGCIGGPGVCTKDTIKVRHKKVIDYLEFAKTEDLGDHRGLIKDTEGVDFSTPNEYVDNKYFEECERDFDNTKDN